MTQTLPPTSDPAAPAKARSERSMRRLRRVALAVAVVGAVGIGAALAAKDQTADVESSRDVATAERNSLADPVLELCNAGGPDAQALRDAGKCELAAKVVADPAPPPPGLDRDEVLELIRSELAEQVPSGQAPTMEQLQAAARTVIEANPDAYRGGPPATDEQVDAAVAAYLQANPDTVKGDKGDPGPQGVGIADVDGPRTAGSRCVLVITLRDPADGTRSTVTLTVPDALCDTDPAPSPTPEPEPEPTPTVAPAPAPAPDPTDPTTDPTG